MSKLLLDKIVAWTMHNEDTSIGPDILAFCDWLRVMNANSGGSKHSNKDTANCH